MDKLSNPKEYDILIKSDPNVYVVKYWNEYKLESKLFNKTQDKINTILDITKEITRNCFKFLESIKKSVAIPPTNREKINDNNIILY